MKMYEYEKTQDIQMIMLFIVELFEIRYVLR